MAKALIKYPVITAVAIGREKTKRGWKKLGPVPQTEDGERPRKRADCVRGIRPCPFIGCRHNLLIDVTPKGSIKPTVNLEDIPQDRPSCSLDLAAYGEVKTEKIADLLTMTEDNVQRITCRALVKVRKALGIKRHESYAQLPDQSYV